MKKISIAMAMALMVVMGVGSVEAEMVDIGTGQMEQSEYMDLRAMIQGRQADGEPAVSTPVARVEQYGLVELSQADFDALRNKVANRSDAATVAPRSKAVIEMVDIGTGEMPMDEFAALKRMVEESNGPCCAHLATLQR